MYPKTPGCFSDLSAALYYKSYCFFLKLLIVLPVHFPLLHFTPPKVLRFYYNLTFRCVRYFGGSANLNPAICLLRKTRHSSRSASVMLRRSLRCNLFLRTLLFVWPNMVEILYPIPPPTPPPPWGGEGERKAAL